MRSLAPAVKRGDFLSITRGRLACRGTCRRARAHPCCQWLELSLQKDLPESSSSPRVPPRTPGRTCPGGALGHGRWLPGQPVKNEEECLSLPNFQTGSCLTPLVTTKHHYMPHCRHPHLSRPLEFQLSFVPRSSSWVWSTPGIVDPLLFVARRAAKVLAAHPAPPGPLKQHVLRFADQTSLDAGAFVTCKEKIVSGFATSLVIGTANAFLLAPVAALYKHSLQ